MGNGCTKPGKSKNDVVENAVSIQKTTSDALRPESFKIAYTDLIRKRTNMILDDYKIKSAPMGKG